MARKRKTSQRKRGNRIKSKFRIALRKHKYLENHNVTFWMALVVILVSNLVVSVVLIPFLIILENVPLYILIILFGLMFGSLFKLTLDSIGNFESKHRYIASFFIPALAIINIAVITTLSNKMVELLELTTTQNPVVLGLLYALAFITPFIYVPILDKIKSLF